MNKYIGVIKTQKKTSGSMSRHDKVSGVNYDAVATANFQIEKAEKDSSVVDYRKSMDQASETEIKGGLFTSGGFYKNDVFWEGPETDAEANTVVGCAIAIQARSMPANQRAPFIKLAKEYVNKGGSAWQLNRNTNRQKILNEAADKLEGLLEPHARQIGVNKRGELKSPPLAVLKTAAQKENLQFRVPSYPELLTEAIVESAKDAGHAARRTAKIGDRIASTIFGEPCRPDETEAECAKRQTRDTYIRYGLFGIFGLTALGAVGIYYVNTIKGAIKSVTGDKPKQSPKRQIIEQQITAQEQ